MPPPNPPPQNNRRQRQLRLLGRARRHPLARAQVPAEDHRRAGGAGPQPDGDQRDGGVCGWVWEGARALQIMIGCWIDSLTILPKYTTPTNRDGGGPVPDQRALDDRGGRPHQARDRQGLVGG